MDSGCGSHLSVSVSPEEYRRRQGGVNFQEQSCPKQSVHFISLWRSNCSSVVDDQLHMMAYLRCDFHLHGLQSTHTELLEARGGAGNSIEARSCPISCHVPEIAALLLIWGKTGNLRTMPEKICFLTRAVCRVSTLAHVHDHPPLLVRNGNNFFDKCATLVSIPLGLIKFIGELTVYTAGVPVVGYPGVCNHEVPLVLGRH